MSKALFFNALPDEASETGYDRNYNADDLSDFLSIVCDTGVVKTNNDASGKPQGLKVVAASGMEVNVNAGKAVIKGKAFINETLQSFTLSANGTAANRYDYIVVRFNNNVSARNITLELHEGTSSIPTASALVNTDKVKELMLAYITVAPSVTSIAQANITDTRGNTELCPWFTAVKGYEEYYDAAMETHESTVTLGSISDTVITDIPSSLYNSKYSLIEVYTNGIKEAETAFTSSVSAGHIVIKFAAQKSAGAKVTVILNNFVDGEGMTTALAQYTQLVQDVANLMTTGELDYVCNGVNDNIILSRLVQAFVTGNATRYEDMTIRIHGKFVASAPYQGDGSSTTPYIWLVAGSGNAATRRVYLDFGNCEQITLPTGEAGKYYTVFYGLETHIKNCNIIANGAEAYINMFSSPSATMNFCEDCRFWVTCAGGFVSRGGTFRNCRISFTTTVDNAYIFNVTTLGLLRVFGGEYLCYAPTGMFSTVVYVNASQTGAVVVTYGMNCPENARSNYVQTYAINCLTNNALCSFSDTITTLAIEAAGQNIRGTIKISKAGMM